MRPYRNFPSQLRLYSVIILYISIGFRTLKEKVNYIQHTYSEGKEAPASSDKNWCQKWLCFLISIHFLVLSLMKKGSFADNAKYQRG